MNTEPICKMLEDYVDDDLSFDLKSRFESHLDSCLGCQSRLQEIRELDSLLAQAWKQVDLGSDQADTTVVNSLAPTSGGHNSLLLISTISALAAVVLIAIGISLLPDKPEAEIAETKKQNSQQATTIAKHSPRVQNDDAEPARIVEAGYQTSFATASFDSATKGLKIETNKEFTVYQVIPKVTFSKTN